MKIRVGLVALLLAWPVALAQGQEVASGPEKGSKLPPLQVFDVTGAGQGKEVDYTAERKGMPTAYLFLRADKWDRPMARFLKALDKAVQQEGPGAALVAVWLTEDVEKTKEYLPRAQQSLQFQATALTCFTGEKAGPKGWGLNGDAHLTAVVASRGKAVAVFGYQSLNETNAPAVLKALKEARAGK
jgi:hypothetical protein